jgi:hypothetical protein
LEPTIASIKRANSITPVTLKWLIGVTASFFLLGTRLVDVVGFIANQNVAYVFVSLGFAAIVSGILLFATATLERFVVATSFFSTFFANDIAGTSFQRFFWVWLLVMVAYGLFCRRLIHRNKAFEAAK